ncbi:TMEM165/GDT1 family protein [Caulobacter sp. RL271]|uniref:GDT1 family protein n=1 Tax=Caulobacter segnis TaxID=88688 RepID=A0ABY4ZRM7_9CAUL|nr:TMEM165/GDT1 family protein [Caulobacter segnis]USQ94611.1 TMEM165/GDT1 family protein [Caulobacter segnis]
MESLLVSTLVVAIAEIGDKTQLLAIILATRFKKPVPIILGILVATLANHALAATAGYWVSDLLSGAWFKWAIAISFIAMAAWALIPDKADDEDAPSARRYGVFMTTAIAFFLVEMGDKTQIATVALGAKFHSIGWVAAGTTLGMMLANVPAVYLGEAATKVVPLKYVRIGAAVIFLLLGLWQVAELVGILK